MATGLWTGRYGLRMPGREGDFSLLRNFRTGSGAHPVSYSMCTEVKGRGMMIYLHLASRLWRSGTDILRALHAAMVWTGTDLPLVCLFKRRTDILVSH